MDHGAEGIRTHDLQNASLALSQPELPPRFFFVDVHIPRDPPPRRYRGYDAIYNPVIPSTRCRASPVKLYQRSPSRGFTPRVDKAHPSSPATHRHASFFF